MKDGIFVSCGPGERRIACVINDELQHYTIWRPAAPDGVGDVYRGRVIAVAPGMAGAFVALGGQDGFLPDSAGAAGLGVGDKLPVAVTRAAQSGKGPRLSAKLDAAQAGLAAQFPGDGLIASGPTPLQRLRDLHPDLPVMIDDSGLAAELAGAARMVPKAFDNWLEDETAQLAATTVQIASGGQFSITPTPALVAIDCDAGGEIAAATESGKVHFQANLRLMPVLARHIRLRNLSGAILIDFAGLPVKKRQSLTPALEQALAKDKLARLLGFTALGLAEIMRSRVHPPLHDYLATPLAKGLTILRQALAEAPLTGALTVAMPRVYAQAVRRDPDALDFCVRKRGYPVLIAES